MYEMPLIYVFGGWVLGWGEHILYWGFGQWHFVIGILSRDQQTQMPLLLITVRSGYMKEKSIILFIMDRLLYECGAAFLNCIE